MIIHFTTVHSREDSRIRYKQVASLSKGLTQEVRIYVQDGQGDETDSALGYKIVDTGPRAKRLRRMTFGAWRMINAVRKARPSIAHFHDPELLPWALLLRLWGIRVVYDVHEDYPQAIQHNRRLPKFARKTLPPVVRVVEWVGSLLLSGIVTVTPKINERFPKRKTIMIRNFPDLSEFDTAEMTPIAVRPEKFAYVGTITRNRNILGMIDAVQGLRSVKARLWLAGTFHIAEDEQSARALLGWERVYFEGRVSRAGVARILGSSRAGLVVLKPVAHEMETYPIKLFEYMAAGLPVISSDFPIWREIVEGAKCGILVDPEKTDEITKAMQWILDHPDDAQEMGRSGRQAVLEHYNWEREAERLVSYYQHLLDA